MAKRIFASATAALALGMGSAASQDISMQPISGDPVSTANGRIVGTQLASGVRAYLGIPYAAPPTGNLRWAAPQPISWKGIWNADRKGPECIQVLRPHNINHYFGEEPSSENCLYMNVWTPGQAKAGGGLPVIVFMYGGGYTIGSSGMANYDGEAMARAGAVFVNFNYRVGALGFMAHPELSAEQGGRSGNYGFMDQVAALKWVRANIAKFGGDPNKVVIMGQSAGAGSVATQIFNPLAKGLFRGAVMSSGCNYQQDGTPLDVAEKTGTALQEKLGASSLDDLRQLPADRILAVQSESQVGVRVEGVRIGGPVIDGYVVPGRKSELLASGQFNKVPVIASYNADEGSGGYEPLLAARTLAEYRAAAEAMYPGKGAAFLKLYPVRSDAEVRKVARRAATDAGLESGALFCAQAQQKAGLPIFIDEYSRWHPYVAGVKIADQDTATVGAYHTADIPYWFGTQDKYNWQRRTRDWQPWDRTLSNHMMRALIAFADTGNPSTAELPWPNAAQGRERKIIFGDRIETVTLNQARIAWHRANRSVARPAPRRTGGPRD